MTAVHVHNMLKDRAKQRYNSFTVPIDVLHIKKKKTNSNILSQYRSYFHYIHKTMIIVYTLY